MLPHDSSCFLLLVKFRAQWQLLYSFQTYSTVVASDHFMETDGNGLRDPPKARCLILSVHGLRIPNRASQDRMDSDHGHSQTTSCRVRPMIDFLLSPLTKEEGGTFSQSRETNHVPFRRIRTSPTQLTWNAQIAGIHSVFKRWRFVKWVTLCSHWQDKIILMLSA